MDHSKILIQRAMIPSITTVAVCFVLFYPSSMNSFLNSSHLLLWDLQLPGPETVI